MHPKNNGQLSAFGDFNKTIEKNKHLAFLYIFKGALVVALNKTIDNEPDL
jgi:hypothetical protein